MPYIASTLSCDNFYAEYHPAVDGGGPREIRAGVLIKGGANVASRHHAIADHILTPQGVVTNVTDHQLEMLQQNSAFQMHLKNGFVKVFNSNIKGEKAAKEMTAADKSAPYTPNDYKPGGRANAPAGLKISENKVLQ